MSRATPKMRDFAERLIVYETRGNKSSETKTQAAFLVGEKLRPQLAALMGNVGFRALISRALALSNAEIPWLRDHCNKWIKLRPCRRLLAHVTRRHRE